MASASQILETPAVARDAALKAKVASLRLSSTEKRPLPSRLPWALCVVLVCTTLYFANLSQRPATAVESTATETGQQNASPQTAGATGAATGGAANPTASPTASPASGATKIAPDQIALEAKGYIVPAQQILVSPKVSGMLVSLNIVEGRRVAKGDVLAQIETTEYDADFARVKANLALAAARLLELENGSRQEEKDQARADLNEAEQNLEQYRAAWERARNLKLKKALSEGDYDQAETQFQTAEQRVARLKSTLDLILNGPRPERIEQARAEVAQAQADLKKAQWRLDNTTVRAPISGTILKKNAEEGNIVNPVAFNGSFSLCDMADLSKLEVDLSINERDIGRVFTKQRCEVAADAYPNRKYVGVVDRVMPIADRAKGTVSVRVRLTIPAEEEGVYLKPDMAALVRFYGEPPTSEAPKS